MDSPASWSASRRAGASCRPRRGGTHGDRAGRGRSRRTSRWSGSQRGPRARGGGDPARPCPVPGQPRDRSRAHPVALGRHRRGARGPTGIVQARQARPDRDRRDRVRAGAAGRPDRCTGCRRRWSSRPSRRTEALQIPLRATRAFSAVAEAADSTPIPEARITWEVADTTIGDLRSATGTLDGPRHRRHDAHGAPPRLRAGGLAAPRHARACSGSTGPALGLGLGERVDARRRACSTRRARSSRPPAASSGPATGPRSRW